MKQRDLGVPPVRKPGQIYFHPSLMSKPANPTCFNRRAALGEPLKPFEKRVAEAMHRIHTLHSWTPAQRMWLDRLAKQLTHEVISDRKT